MSNTPFNQDEVIRRHPSEILPPLVGIRMYAKRLSLEAIWIKQGNRHNILLRVHTSIITQRKRRIKRYMIDRPPEVNELVAMLEKLRYFLRGKMFVHTSEGGSRRLVDVCANDRLALIR